MSFVIVWWRRSTTSTASYLGPYFSETEALRDARVLTERVGGTTHVTPMIDPGKVKPLHKPRPQPRR